MTRREVLDTYLRDRAVALGVTPLNALVTEVSVCIHINMYVYMYIYTRTRIHI
jgi:hypothetical protein